jgi:hypothetical protein
MITGYRFILGPSFAWRLLIYIDAIEPGRQTVSDV